MCGICGFTGNKQEQKKDILTNMMNKIAHRGPDDAGWYMDSDINLGFRRLSIIDIDNGLQPMRDVDDEIVVVFNGEIYNYKELKKELMEKGYTFLNNTDTEVLIYGYKEYGVRLVYKLRGMFAFLIWDKRKKQAFAARDHFGIKPFYYSIIDGELVFASEIKSILEYPDYKKELNTEALCAYLTFQYSVLPETFFKGIYKLMPGHVMIFRDGEMKIKRYFEPNFLPEKGLTLEDWVKQIDDATENSIRYHMVSDVEVASLLSSGVDSSYIAARFGGEKTFTVGFENDGYDEISYAKSFAENKNLLNYSKTITAEEYWKVLPEVSYYMDEPLGDASCVALYFVDGEAAKQVKVVLSGEGADEVFGGYQIYHEPISLQLFKNIPNPLKKIMKNVAGLIPDIKGKSFVIRGCTPLRERFVGNAFRFRETEVAKLLKNPSGVENKEKGEQEYFRNKSIKGSKWHKRTGSSDKGVSYIERITGPYYDRALKSGLDDITTMQYIDMNFWLIGDILLKADKMSMAHSLESRVPFLDKELFKVARKMPTEFKIHDKVTKYAFRECAKKYLPDETASKKKLGFPVPIARYIREEKYYNKIKTAFTSRAAEQYFYTDKLVKMLDVHKSGKKDLSKKIWTVYMFLVWYDVYFSNQSM